MILSEFRLNEDAFLLGAEGRMCKKLCVYQAKIKLEKFERGFFERKNVQPRLLAQCGFDLQKLFRQAKFWEWVTKSLHSGGLP